MIDRLPLLTLRRQTKRFAGQEHLWSQSDTHRLVPRSSDTFILHGIRFGSTLLILKDLGLDRVGYSGRRQLLQKTISPQNFIARGCYNAVYRIPGAEKQYVLRVPLKTPALGSLVRVKTPLEALTDVGNVVATMGDYEIIRYQSGGHCGVPMSLAFSDTEESRKAYLQYLKKAAQMPQEAYNQLARTIVALSQTGYYFDYCQARNILMDEDSGRFKLVDFHKGGALTWAEMVAPLLDTLHSWSMSSQMPPEITQMRSVILDKCIEAACQVDIPLPPVNSAPFENIYHHPRIEYSFFLAGAGRQKQWPMVRNSILENRQRRKTLK